MSRSAERLCPACSKPTSALGRLCVHCGAELEIDRFRRTQEAIECPACSARTTVVCLGGIEIDLCTDCSGAWFDRGEIDRATETFSDADIAEEARSMLGLVSATHQRDASPVRYVACPVCGSTMSRNDYRDVSGIVVDVCARDGVWLDRGDLARLLDLLAHGGVDALERRSGAVERSKLEERAFRLEAKLDEAKDRSRALRWRSFLHRLF